MFLDRQQRFPGKALPLCRKPIMRMIFLTTIRTRTTEKKRHLFFTMMEGKVKVVRLIFVSDDRLQIKQQYVSIIPVSQTPHVYIIFYHNNN